MSDETKTLQQKLYDAAIRFEGGEPSGLLVAAGDALAAMTAERDAWKIGKEQMQAALQGTAREKDDLARKLAEVREALVLITDMSLIASDENAGRGEGNAMSDKMPTPETNTEFKEHGSTTSTKAYRDTDLVRAKFASNLERRLTVAIELLECYDHFATVRDGLRQIAAIKAELE